jgi:hypothetical protein
MPTTNQGYVVFVGLKTIHRRHLGDTKVKLSEQVEFGGSLGKQSQR